MKRIKMVPILVGLLVCSALLFTTCAANEDEKTPTSPVGIYVGVFSYDANGQTDLVEAQSENVQVSLANSSLTYLSDNNNAKIQQYVLPTYVQGDTSGQALMYTIDKVIDNLKASEEQLNSKLDNVTIVSFSSGVDQASVDLGDYNGLEECGDTLHAKINNTTIKGKHIAAYSVILSDTNNPSDDIKKTAQWVTSGDGAWGDSPFIKRASSLTTAVLDPIFSNIATGLPGIQTSKSVTITINGPENISTINQDGDRTNFCAVFNGKTPIDADAVYIKGFIQKKYPEGSNYEISPIKYKGVTGTPPSVVEASGKNGTIFSFNFPGVEGSFPSVKQYKYVGGSTVWDPLSDAGTSTEIPAGPKTAIVVLVLDASITTTEIDTIRSAAGKFIQTLYEQSKK